MIYFNLFFYLHSMARLVSALYRGYIGIICELYKAHGKLCASYPWEVIVGTFAAIAFIFSVDSSRFLKYASSERYQTPHCKEQIEINVVLMTFIRCAAVMYCFCQFCNLQKLGTKYIGIAAIFTIVSGLILSSSAMSYLSTESSDFKDGVCFFIILIDIPNVALLAQFALRANINEDFKNNIAHGISLLGPTITLDTVVKILVISNGALSGIKKLEILSNLAGMAVMVNYFVFMTFYPSLLSLIIELTNSCEPKIIISQKYKMEGEHMERILKSNPILQRMKLVMSASLLTLHFLCQWSKKELNNESHGAFLFLNKKFYFDNSNYTGDVTKLRWFTMTSYNVVFLLLLFGLAIKFIFFEDEDVLPKSVGKLNAKSLLGEEYTLSAIKKMEKITDCDGLTITLLKNEPRKYSDKIKSFEECIEIYKEARSENLTDEEIELLVNKNIIQTYQLEKVVNNAERGVKIRRKIIGSNSRFMNVFENIPYKCYDYSKVLGACCENIVGYIPIPLGVAGPLFLDNEMINVPMATTEGCLVASTNRGCRALLPNGVTSRVVGDGMTRGPVVRFASASRASEAMLWIKTGENFLKIKESFDSTSRYAKLINVQVRIAGRHLFIRFVATTGDAMGMNMVSKGTEIALNFVQKTFPDMEVISLSGNFCSDKKPAAVNWIEGRGKYVVCEAVVSSESIKTILKTTVNALVDVNINKNLVGTAIAGSIGGCNAHAANVVTAIYIATGQDPAQNVTSSNCITLMEPWGDFGHDLYISCTMPSIEIGTVGGGTQLSPQAACLDMLGVKGANDDIPGENANKLARIVCGSVLAGELSLMSALAAGHLVKSHLRHNRSSQAVNDLTQYGMKFV